MKIHGLRIYPQSIEVTGRKNTTIFIHGQVSEECSDFLYIFRCMASTWQDLVFTETFGIAFDEEFDLEDSLVGLRGKYGASFIDTDLDGDLILLRGGDFASWGKTMQFCEGALLPIFRERPSFDLLERFYRDNDFILTSENWPSELRAILHMWDDIYWQMFTTVRSDLDVLIRSHIDDSKLKLYSVEFDREYPDPSNQKLLPATLSDEQ
jgi:hypothetical protein